MRDTRPRNVPLFYGACLALACHSASMFVTQDFTDKNNFENSEINLINQKSTANSTKQLISEWLYDTVQRYSTNQYTDNYYAYGSGPVALGWRCLFAGRVIGIDMSTVKRALLQSSLTLFDHSHHSGFVFCRPCSVGWRTQPVLRGAAVVVVRAEVMRGTAGVMTRASLTTTAATMSTLNAMVCIHILRGFIRIRCLD